MKYTFTLKKLIIDCFIECYKLLKKLFNNVVVKEDIKPPPIILRVVPLANFTVNDLPTQKLQELIDDIRDLNRSDFLVFLKNVFKHIFIPRGYRVNRKNSKKLSPLTQIVN